MKGLIGSMSRKWKIEQILTFDINPKKFLIVFLKISHGTSKKLEIENKLMEERLNQLKTEMNKEKEQRRYSL